MRALPVLLLGLCAAVVAVVAWPSPEDPPPAPPHRAAEVPAPGTAGPSGTDPAPVAASTALDDPAAPDEQPDEIRVDAAGPEDPRGPQVAVVRGTPPVPVAGAAVYFVTEADAADRDRRNGGGT
ncbi:MAG: hypothetical protein FJ265_21045, partial [Planctomycetes bacterium]|nr:hypothetical protein [Planctomycetota bacterium]